MADQTNLHTKISCTGGAGDGGRGWWQDMGNYPHLISLLAVFSQLQWFYRFREFLCHCARQHATHCDFVPLAPRCQGIN